MTNRHLWHTNAIIYAVDVEVFCDSDDDGVGDFAGLTNQLDYLAGLGVTCLWVMPFYPTPNRDNGYDVTDYYGVDPRLGSLCDVARFLHEAENQGIRVIIDLVVNHTSDQHPWFQDARRDPNSPYRDFYIWRDRPPEDSRSQQIVFTPGEDISPWTYDDEVGAYYWHRFYDFEPDLNLQHPRVRDEVHKIIGFWLQLGVAGFRIDAAPYLGDKPPSGAAKPAATHAMLRSMRETAAAFRGDAVLIAEADVAPDRLGDYFGDGQEVHILFNFYVNNFLYLALARQQAEPLRRAYRDLPPVPAQGQWLNWVRNYDELDLERLPEESRQEVYRVFAPEERMRIYGRGIRRRFPPMVDGDRSRMELAYSLMLSLPGTPMLLYGEEIGMGDDLTLQGRNSVRTPMQWSAAPNGGFSRANPGQFPRPVIPEGMFGFPQINVADQRLDPDSFLNWMIRAIRIWRESPVIGAGEFRLLETHDPSVFAHACVSQDDAVLAVHNLAGQPCTVTVGVDDAPLDGLIEVLRDHPYSDEPACRRVAIGPYGYRWFRSHRA